VCGGVLMRCGTASLRCIDSNGHGVVTKTACTSVGAPCDARH
jgi:hypothetical protein